jgi:pimeloyl-ACP methyl ester carboxylesterase
MITHHLRRKLRHLGLAFTATSVLSIIVGPFLVPIRPLKDTVPPQTLGDPDSQFIEINGQTIHVKIMGQGDTVFLLLHGFAASLYSWHAVMDPLSQLGMAIAYDRTGFGLSTHPLTWTGQNPYSAEAQVAQVIGLLVHFGARQAVLVGNSAGGTVAMKTALAHPERVSALVLVDPAVYITAKAPAWLPLLLSTPQMRHLGPLFARQLVARGPDMLNLAWHDPSRIQPDTLELYKKPYQVENWDRALWEFTLANRGPSLTQHLTEINIPSLVITGDDDRIIPTKDSIRLAEELPNARLVVIPDAGHIPHEECPSAFMEAVTSFLGEPTHDRDAKA